MYVQCSGIVIKYKVKCHIASFIIFEILDHSRKKALQFPKTSISGSENQFKLLASTAVSDGCYVGIAVIASEVVCISVYYDEQTPSCSLSESSDSSSNDDMGLSLIKPMIRGKDFCRWKFRANDYIQFCKRCNYRPALWRELNLRPCDPGAAF